MREPRHIEIMAHDTWLNGMIVTWLIDRPGKRREFKSLTTIKDQHGQVYRWTDAKEALDNHARLLAQYRAMN